MREKETPTREKRNNETKTLVGAIHLCQPMVIRTIMRHFEQPPRKVKNQIGSGLDRDKRFNAPARRVKKFAKAREILSISPDVLFLGDYCITFRDKTKLYCNATGDIVSTGGLSTRHKFENRFM